MNNATVCSFCKKSYKENVCLIKNKSTHICRDCVHICFEMIQQSEMHIDKNRLNLDMMPIDIYRKISSTVIGQDHAKKIISVSVFIHMQRIKNNVGEKSNILLLGPTGSGKTLIAQSIQKVLNLPMIFIDATTLTEIGYVGDDIEIIGQKLLAAADKNVQLAEKGIVFIDEIDKIAKLDNVHVSRGGVQRGLLTILENSYISVSSKNSLKSSADSIQISTKDILFICSGAFEGIHSIVEQRVRGNSIGIGSSLNSKNYIHEVLTSDLISYGMMPELLGRLPILASVDPLSKEDLKDIILKSDSSPYYKYKSFCAKLNIRLEITDDAVERIAYLAQKQNIGARGVKSILEKILIDGVFNLKNNDKAGTLTIDRENVDGKPLVLKTKKISHKNLSNTCY